MALNANALASVANVKTYLGITVSTFDSLIELLINSNSEWIENETGRVLLDAGSDVTELHDGDFDHTGRDKIFPKQWPLNSITSIEFKTGSLGSPTWVAFTTDEFTTDDPAGIIYFTGFAGSNLASIQPNRQNIRLIYQGGFTTTPSDLELACIKMTAKEFDKRKSQGVTQESVGGGTVTWNEELDPEVLKIIKKYRRFF